MNGSLTPDDRLLRNLLAETEQAVEQQSNGPHPDEESLVLFTRRALPAAEREVIVQHLDICASCRQTVSYFLRLDEAEEQPTVAPNVIVARWSTARLTAFALAACLLVAVGILIFGPGSGRELADARYYQAAKRQIEQGQFAEAQETIGNAEKDGVRSDRLRSLDAQAERQMPAALALAYAGRLTQFGYDVNGTMTKDFGPLPISQGAKQAVELLKSAQNSELEAVLNRGHALLSIGQPKPALQEFARAIELDPKNSYAWLGRGMAEFANDDYTAAEKSFREALKLDAHSTAAQMNLAMTLAEQGRTGDAVTLWKNLLQQSLSDNDRKLTNRAVSELEMK